MKRIEFNNTIAHDLGQLIWIERRDSRDWRLKEYYFENIRDELWDQLKGQVFYPIRILIKK